MILNLKLDLPEDGYYLRIARLISRTLLEHLKVVDRDIDDIEIIVGELCANVLRHGDSAEGRFHIALEYYNDRIEIVVEDTGPGFSRSQVLPVGAERPDFGGGKRLGGFGMSLLERLSDQIDFKTTDPHGTTARAIKTLHYATQEDADEAEKINASSGAMSIRWRQ